MKRFLLRPFVSFGLLWSFLVAAVSGIVLYFRPEGSLASWTNWSVLGLDKKTWEAVHTLGIAALVIFSILHIILNWKLLWGYLRKTAAQGAGSKAECALSLLLVAVITAGAIGGWEPFQRLIAARSAIKQGNLSIDVAPPFADAADRSLADICAAAPLSLDEGLRRLAAAGYTVSDPSRTL
ncbi:MAG: DUF4405 domain-containing protein, partial [Candidatus Aminicenantes bacterium]|nr:DUF4405 domain-containing protein [Candidatus Aminicenantes bacterium]